MTAGFLADDIPFPTAIAQAAADTANTLRLGTVVAFTERQHCSSRVALSAELAHRGVYAECRHLSPAGDRVGCYPAALPAVRLDRRDDLPVGRVLLDKGLVAPGEWWR